MFFAVTKKTNGTYCDLPGYILTGFTLISSVVVPVPLKSSVVFTVSKCQFIEHDYVTPLMYSCIDCPVNRYVLRSRLNCSASTDGSHRLLVRRQKLHTGFARLLESPAKSWNFCWRVSRTWNILGNDLGSGKSWSVLGNDADGRFYNIT